MRVVGDQRVEAFTSAMTGVDVGHQAEEGVTYWAARAQFGAIGHSWTSITLAPSHRGRADFDWPDEGIMITTDV